MELNQKYGHKNIEGWLGSKDLFDRIIREANQNDFCLFINGDAKSICYIASRAKLTKKLIRFINIAKNDEFKEKLIKAGVIDIVSTIQADPHRNHIIKSLANNSIFAIFINSYDYSMTLQLIKVCKNKLKNGGYLAGKNIAIPSVAKAVSETLKNYQTTKDSYPMWFKQV